MGPDSFEGSAAPLTEVHAFTSGGVHAVVALEAACLDDADGSQQGCDAVDDATFSTVPGSEVGDDVTLLHVYLSGWWF